MSTTPMTKIREEFIKEFPSISVIEGIGDFGSIHGYDPTKEILDWFINRFQQELEKLEGEIEKAKVNMACDLPDVKMCQKCEDGLIYNQALSDVLEIIRQHKEG